MSQVTESDLAKPDLGKKILQEVLRPISFCYGLGASARLLSYSNGLAFSTAAAVPVISVGNITVGGTGKTPLTIDLARRFIARGVKVAILSRGYGRKSKGLLVVADGAKTLVSVEDAGDEPFLMAASVPQAVVIVCSSRVESAELAVSTYGAQLIILDDGFQHVKLKRDIDCVLWDFNDDPLKSMIVPSGRLREPLSGLHRASDIIVTKVPVQEETRADAVKAELARLAPRANIYSCRFAPAHLVQLAQSDNSGKFSGRQSLAELAGKKVYALSAIARPEGFIRELKGLGVSVVKERAFADHHWFSPAQIAEIEAEFTASGADIIVTTEKDLVRLEMPPALASKTFAVALECQWLARPPAFIETLALDASSGDSGGGSR